LRPSDFAARDHPLSRVPNVSVTAPLLELRGLKMNVPLDARTPSYADAGDSAQQNIASMWDMEFWTQHLDHMAKHRYNLLSLWSDSPWASMLDFSGTPYASMSSGMDNVYRANIDWVAVNRRSITDLVTPDSLAHLELVKAISVADKVKFWQAVMEHADQRGIKVMLVTPAPVAFPTPRNYSWGPKKVLWRFPVCHIYFKCLLSRPG
jgi:hypothetical protein